MRALGGPAGHISSSVLVESYLDALQAGAPAKVVVPSLESRGARPLALDGFWFTAPGEGRRPALVLLHGFPQTHVMWHKIAPTLAKTHRVIAMDLRGYGWSTAPRSDERHETYSKREMAKDAAASSSIPT